MLLVVDNGSVYTQKLLEFLSKSKIPFDVLTFDRIDLQNLSHYTSIILSGRRRNDKKMNYINSKIVSFALNQNIPLLGICYGAEILALSVGGTIKKMPYLQKGNNKIIINLTNPICTSEMEVFESHSYEISKIPKSLQVVASSQTCKNEIICHENSFVFGTQFHPEMTEDGQNLIKKFCSLNDFNWSN